MCNQDIECLNNSLVHSDNQEAVFSMDSPSAIGSTPGSKDETPRVKFLCSFLGSILPRPHDGKLRYVGGETRIVSLPRDVSYEEVMNRMRELYEGAVVLKYQQPDEDLDALVSVVNDDDVANMMEEYDKLGSGEGFTRLRIFLFSHPDQDGSRHYLDGDDRETERMYVDALNNMNDGNDFRKMQPDSPVLAPVDDIHLADRFFNTMSLEGGLHNQPQFNMHHLTIPHMGSGQLQQPVTQRYNEVEGPWSPAYYSPRHNGHHDPRPLPEFPSSPSSAWHQMPFGEDRLPDEYAWQHVNHHPTYEPQLQISENLGRMQPGGISGDKSGFPGNTLHGHNVCDANGVFDHCRPIVHRNHLHLEQPSMGNGFPQGLNPLAEYHSNRENFLLNAEAKLPRGMYPKDQNDTQPFYNESQSHERGWILQHQLNTWVDNARTHVPGAGRLSDPYMVDSPGMNFPLVHGNLAEGHRTSAKHVHHRAGPERGSEMFHDQAVAAPHMHVHPPEERVRYGNFPYGGDNLQPASHGHVHTHSLWQNVQNPMHGAPSYEASTPIVNGSINPAFIRGTVDGNPRLGVGLDNQNSWVESSTKVQGFDGTGTPTEYYYGPALKFNPQNNNHGNQSSDPVQSSDSSSVLIHDRLGSSISSVSNTGLGEKNVVEAVQMEDKINLGPENEANHIKEAENINVLRIFSPEQDTVADKSSGPNSLENGEVSGNVVKQGENGPPAPPKDSQLSANCMSFLPDLIASVKRAALEGAEEVKAKVDEDADSNKPDSVPKEVRTNESELMNIHGELEMDPDTDNVNSKIEPTKAEAEAIARGLQTIRNADLEEVRELGSGTYGAVYHGKWKGSDVAIKRIKASCFAGRPSERQRLIADFWKEALLLSSLHHPNVVAFYGIVRDGPDGSLATVTEFMVNGSLKQFLQKKDRTIDRRKRLIIAMDAAFGMEYLHGKNIVHFDLKCENLLVNMRDPQRPVCKIGDLGLSKVKQQTLVSGGVRGTLPWMAPELLSGKSHMVTEKIDVYSFGIVMWELLTGDEPYTDMHVASIIGGIVNNTLRPKLPTWCDPEWKSLMESCWASDPAERPSFSEISQKLRSMAAAINVK
ncbi:uncharacterized protein LOC123200658 [Mangifera indica]|uniref:uncharacterized protein LOC123200658 n=1 Tax=Mangifera indica TaxID=29780 RepID=UPI001CFB9E6B|nr:uncharacterized protein LOC123200658 [Mangifera indica]XP_044471909.1 uncharacterized protein LOC123200658 [Mangifera indica]